MVRDKEAKYIESWPTTASAGADWRSFYISAGLMEFIPCYSVSAVHWGLIPVTRLASRIILIEQNIKRQTRVATLCI
jgi:hypothetical protein